MGGDQTADGGKRSIGSIDDISPAGPPARFKIEGSSKPVGAVHCVSARHLTPPPAPNVDPAACKIATAKQCLRQCKPGQPSEPKGVRVGRLFTVWRSLELEPLCYAATLIAGPSGDLAVRQTLFAQGMELLEYFLARLPMRETGATAVRRSVDDCVLRQEGSAGGTSRKAHLFFDGRAKILDQVKSIGNLSRLRCALANSCA